MNVYKNSDILLSAYSKGAQSLDPLETQNKSEKQMALRILNLSRKGVPSRKERMRRLLEEQELQKKQKEEEKK
jgi:hypothetical protein